MTENMRNALKGSGGGLQSISSAIGDTMGNAANPQTSKQKEASQASDDLRNMGKSKGDTVEGTKISAADQIANQSSGSGDHLGLGMRKEG